MPHKNVENIFIILILINTTIFPQSYAQNDTFKNSSPSKKYHKILKYEKDSTNECGSIDVRNDCNSLLQLQKCSVIRGYLTIALLRDDCDYKSFQFPLLREITDFLIFFDVKGVTTIRDMFPNLTVIRGRRLFLNYALGISNMPDLELLEFQSLIAIQRGHVFIGNCPKLCYLEKINWDRLTLSPGENQIFSTPSEKCSLASCNKCQYCWSNSTCQKFNNDNVLDSKQNSCDSECLGGCYGCSQSECAVCKQLTDHGSCSANCPTNEYLVEHYQRCYTEKECIRELGRYVNESNCVSQCPNGFTLNTTTFHCEACSPDGTENRTESCLKLCQSKSSDETLNIYSLADADYIKGCHIINANLIIAIRNKVNELELMNALEDIREISGYLKIHRSPYITSLKFLRNLRKISGNFLEHNQYGLIIYDNKNLEELWELNTDLKLDNGIVYIHLNNKLCNTRLHKFYDKIMHNRQDDSIQTNDQEVLCGPATIFLSVYAISHNYTTLIWRKDQTFDVVEIIYRPVTNALLMAADQSELDSNVCTRINFERQLLFKKELVNLNETHYSYTMDGLMQNKKYAYLIKTFDDNSRNNMRSLLQFVVTKPDIPQTPIMIVTKKTDNSISILFDEHNRTDDVIDYYSLALHKLADDIDMLDKRNYCQHPIVAYHDIQFFGSHADNYKDDYESCCSRLEELEEDDLFVQNMREEFSCSLDKKHNCLVDVDINQGKPLQNLKIYDDSAIILHNLERYTLYVIKLQACNNVGCSSVNIHNERTDHSQWKNYVIPHDLSACKVAGTTEYQVCFKEPKQPNGLIVSYNIHYRIFVPTTSDSYQSHIQCVTRLHHEQSNYTYRAHLNASFNQIAVRIFSLAGDVLTNWIPVTTCAGTLLDEAIVFNRPHSFNTFLIFFLLGACGTLIWICYKRKLWRKVFNLRRYLYVRSAVRPTDDDRQILIDGFETVRFHNNDDEDQKYLE